MGEQQICDIIAQAVRKCMPFQETKYQEYSQGVTNAIDAAVAAILGIEGEQE